jgi:hypothetical protein
MYRINHGEEKSIILVFGGYNYKEKAKKQTHYA